MKRIKMIILLIIPLLVLTGCTSLNCKIKTSNYTSNIKIKFENDKPTKYHYKDAMDFGNTLSIDSEFYYNNKQAKYSTLISERYAKVIEFQNIVKTKINYDFSKDKSNDEKSLLITQNDSFKIAKEKIEKEGYTCK